MGESKLMPDKSYYVYIMASRSGTLYTGVTNNLLRRVYEHKQAKVGGFSKRYRTFKLVYFETFKDIYSAITREKQIKRWRRSKKVNCIESVNPNWRDLSEDWD
jgi:putative endonuclease